MEFAAEKEDRTRATPVAQSSGTTATSTVEVPADVLRDIQAKLSLVVDRLEHTHHNTVETLDALGGVRNDLERVHDRLEGFEARMERLDRRTRELLRSASEAPLRTVWRWFFTATALLVLFLRWLQ